MKNNLAKKLALLLVLILTISCTRKKEAHELNTDPLLQKVAISLGWNDSTSNSEKIDLDISAFMLKSDGKTRTDDNKDFCFYNNETIANGAVKHSGDSTENGERDSETITVKSAEIPKDVDKVVFTVSFYNDENGAHKFKQVEGAWIRIVDLNTKVELARYNLNQITPDESTLIFGELYRSGNDWKVRILKKGYTGGLLALAKSFGIDAEYSTK